MKTSIAAALVLSLVAGSASAMITPKNIVNEVNSANSYGTVVVHMNGSTATLVGNVESNLDVSQIVQAALRSDGVSRVINLISTNH